MFRSPKGITQCKHGGRAWFYVRSPARYRKYVEEAFPATESVDLLTQAENAERQQRMKTAFTRKGEPGAAFRAVYDRLVRNLTLPRAVRAAFGVGAVQMRESAAPPDPAADWDGNYVRLRVLLPIPFLS